MTVAAALLSLLLVLAAVAWMLWPLRQAAVHDAVACRRQQQPDSADAAPEQVDS